ncbi:MAG: bifunctional D-glycero-beta-D-manno-heptose-7-phosphate kinase/D-glycero-beta-D-manno-heptose 1-phosphate adenylyltransferase HldE [Parvibaculum sp.]|uniref:bifunctional D-glycero-beta-D-manno-heptose-7-phosphate kinase/D-glycero-beta-D-manno-heptose 1-phosphate adenylyltransferase HldE n=1 Tax=Parvibaculum sp. TaxID=2024848 RepID=UPI0028489C17|nr:bifunctional D-glycero-beta-D-manno-heptose-7-phosphate kinase/D-glycero-beta-D-manno-heptose 1-phosphate adenylyltransferase HldE [Parvibaculum sp.]MDR3499422.1 bifunctional D-glycero-beta-D-manno-heptose-7-phosphate kinase/D-glycero-beta-D-manno-heptose 1-phosphate adenylyltransferase HldE [Parvibaculum sp.]
MIDKHRLASELDAFRNTHILCVGDVMLDRYVYGEVRRISPEAPIPVLKVDEERAMLGGAGNVVRNLAALGAQVSFVSVVGQDAAGGEIEAMLKALPGVETRLVAAPKRPSTVKIRYVAMSQQVLRADYETSAALGAALEADVIRHIRALLPKAQVLVLSDYGKGVLSPEVCRAAIEAARALRIPVIVDPKGTDYSSYGGASVVTPNRKELAEATGLALETEEALVAAARALAKRCGIGTLLVTRSREGMSLIAEDGAVRHLPAEAREVFDVSGAGDTVVSTLAVALASGLPLAEAAALANAAAGIVVGKVGTAVVYTDELAAKLREQNRSSVEQKIASLRAAVDVVAGWRRAGLRVGFTNGCFDLLHPGHVSLLAQSRALCDRLVVGLNSDASVRRLKGPTRPVQSDDARATVLASLANVDLVVIFEEDTPEALIEALRPDVLIKGGDYTVETIVGASFVQSYGGKVEIIDLVPGFSTTKTVEKMNG